MQTRSLQSRSLHPEAAESIDGPVTEDRSINITEQGLEHALDNIRFKNGEGSLLQRLQGSGISLADGVKEVLEMLADRAEEHALSFDLVWRYAQLHRAWTGCSDPKLRTERAFLNSLENHKTIKIGIQFGTSTDNARRGCINTIDRQWGATWYEEMCEYGVMARRDRNKYGLSKRYLEKVRDVSRRIKLPHAISTFQEVIQERTKLGSQQSQGSKSLENCDLDQVLALSHDGKSATSAHRASSSRRHKYKTVAFREGQETFCEGGRQVKRRERQGHFSDTIARTDSIVTCPMRFPTVASPPEDAAAAEPLYEQRLPSQALQSATGLSAEIFTDGDYRAVLGHQENVQGCPVCSGVCDICVVPTTFTEGERKQMFESGHRAHILERGAPSPAVRKWISRLAFADATKDSDKLSVVSMEAFDETAAPLRGPVLIKACATFSDEWSILRYADLIDAVFADMTVDVRWHKSPRPKREPSSKIATLCRQSAYCTLGNPPNLLNLPDLTGASLPGFLRLDRFRLLDLVLERCKAKAQSYDPRSPWSLDIESRQNFNLLAWPGAFSGAHVDMKGLTWVMCLTGQKLWMYIPDSRMSDNDWTQLANDGDSWDPGDKAVAILLEPGDVLVLNHRLLHAVYTVGELPCLMSGGFFLDKQDLVHSLRMYHWTAQNQNATNEPLPQQFSEVLDGLQEMVERGLSVRRDDSLGPIEDSFSALRSLGCQCQGCDVNCQCRKNNRRCTLLCKQHASKGAALLPCMHE